MYADNPVKQIRMPMTQNRVLFSLALFMPFKPIHLKNPVSFLAVMSHQMKGISVNNTICTALLMSFCTAISISLYLAFLVKIKYLMFIDKCILLQILSSVNYFLMFFDKYFTKPGKSM